MNKQEWVFSVEELNEYVRRTLTMDPVLHQVKIRGEISNFKSHSSGHWYFSLKDDKSRINCVMFRQYTYGVKLKPKDGQQVVLQGNVSLFVRDGTYQFYAEGMEEEGLGDLYQRFEKLKAKLQAEGLFDSERKKTLPLLPRKIGIITSLTGAVLHDVYQIAMRRFAGIPMVLIPVAVQGSEAPEQIARAVMQMNQVPLVDVMIVGRGGGSLEDLWAFNEEIVARAIAASAIPVISAVGHETDTTIADFVADARAATPSMAAELAVPLKEELLLTLDALTRTMDGAVQKRWLIANQNYVELARRLESKSPAMQTEALLRQSEKAKEKMNYLINDYFSRRSAQMNTLVEKLKALSPLGVLDRGYAMIKREENTVDSIDQLTPSQQIQILLKDGEAEAVVTHTQRRETIG